MSWDNNRFKSKKPVNGLVNPDVDYPRYKWLKVETNPGKLSSFIDGNLDEPDLKGFLSAVNSRGFEMIS